MKNILNVHNDFDIYGSRCGRVEFIDISDIDNKTILDVGCGFGWFINHALSNKAAKVCGIEISDEDIKTARKSISDNKADLKVGTALSIPYPDNYFDTVCAWEVIEHIPINTENEMFKDIYRVLKPGGKFYLSTPYKSFLSVTFDPAWWLIKHRHYSLETLSSIGRNNNFKIVDHIISGGLFSIAYALNMYFSKWILKRKPLIELYFKGKSTKEYKSKKGFVTIFMKYQKV